MSLTESRNPAPVLAPPLTTAAGIVAGLTELGDVVLPLWAGDRLSSSPAQIGVLLAVDLAVACLLRPVAGALTDRVSRPALGACGALLVAAGLALFAVADTFVVAACAAAVTGAGGALFRVPVLALTGTRGTVAAFSALTAAEGTGVWVAYVAGFTLLARFDFTGVFVAGAVAAVVAGGCLLTCASGGLDERGTPDTRGAGGDPWAMLRPFLALVAVVAAVEAGAALLVLLRLQGEFDLGLRGVATVLLPGLIAYSLAPDLGPALGRAFGVANALALTCVASAVAVAGLVLAPTTPWMAAAWVVLCVAWAAAEPLERQVVSRASASQLGRGFGRFETAGLLGGAVGSVAAGWAVVGVPPVLLAVGAAFVVFGCAAATPRALPPGVAKAPGVTDGVV